jgi:plasmid stabilization system protein ParE
MPYLTWSPRSQRDLARIDEFLRTKSPRTADRAFAAILKSVRTLSLFPNSGRPAEQYGRNAREWVVEFGASSYVLLYIVRGEEVLVAALRHSREADYPDLSGS